MTSEKMLTLRINYFALVTFIFMCSVMQSQSDTAVKTERYYAVTSGKFQDAVLILQPNGVYINYGLCVDRESDDFYIWYSKGTYKMSGSNLLCTSISKETDDPELLKTIKESFLHRKDYPLIKNYFECVKAEYKEYKFVVSSAGILDEERKLIYETKNVR